MRRVLERVAASPRDLAQILATYPQPLIAFTTDRTIRAANKAAEDFFGYSAGELVGQSTDTMVPVRLRQPDAPPMQAFDTLTSVDLPGLRRDGSEPHLSWTFGSVNDGDEPIFVMVIRDRAEIEAALEALHASEAQFRLLVEGVRDHAVIMLDKDGRIATWNSGAEAIKGWRADEIIGKHYELFFSPEDRAAGIPARNLAAALTDGRNQVSGWRVRKDGTRFYAEASLWPLIGADGSLQGYAKITHDLTAKRAADEAERRLAIERAGNERLARLHRAAQALSRAATSDEVVAAILNDCLAELNADGALVYQLTRDENTLRMLGQRGHADGMLEDYAAIPMDLSMPAWETLQSKQARFFENADVFTRQYPRFASSARLGGFEAGVLLPLVAHGIGLGVLGVRYTQSREFSAEDRSLLLTMAEMCAQALDRARLLESERAARGDAEAASRAKDEFLAMLGHELRNPLAPIFTAVELMKMRAEDQFKREREVIERQLAHINHLVDDLLDVSRITRGKLDLNFTPLDVADVVTRAMEMASPLLEQRRHHVSLKVPRGLIISADPARMAQVMSNLLTNAAKYTPPGGRIEVVASVKDQDVVLDVRDNGDGIAPDLLPRVFELFVQGKRTVDRSEGGLGIGLALVKNLVTIQGGTVTAASEGKPGRGSVFTVRMPRASLGKSDADREPATSNRPHSGKRVLIVDDNRDFAEMLAGTLSALGYDVRYAIDGVAALEMLGSLDADAAVLDLGLPVIDGFELARQIREKFSSRAPRLIAVTGYGQAHDRVRSNAAGFDAHLVKPIDVNAVVAALEGGPVATA